MNNSLKIGIIGLGPVGMILAVHLKESGYQVAVCDIDKTKINLIRKKGIYLEGIMNKHCLFAHVFGGDNELVAFKPDIVFVAVKPGTISEKLSPSVREKSTEPAEKVLFADSSMSEKDELVEPIIKRLMIKIRNMDLRSLMLAIFLF